MPNEITCPKCGADYGDPRKWEFSQIHGGDWMVGSADPTDPDWNQTAGQIRALVREHREAGDRVVWHPDAPRLPGYVVPAKAFDFEGVRITDPTEDETARRDVDPWEHYGLAYFHALTWADLQRADRGQLITWLCMNDRNGCYTDEDTRLEGFEPLTRETALELIADALED